MVVLSYLSVLDNPSAMASRQMFYLLSEFQRLRPELVTITWGSPDGEDEVVPAIFPQAAQQLRGRPNVAFAFYRSSVPPSVWAAAVDEQLPEDTVILAASSGPYRRTLAEMCRLTADLSFMLSALS